MYSYRNRLIDPLLASLLATQPAIMLVGPRASGKTTTALRHATTTVRLDSPAQAGAFKADPDAALRNLAEPILLDEWQEVPSVLGAVKRSVDADPRPGRFIVTGSVRSPFSNEMWPGTGRLTRLSLQGLSVREQLRRTTAPALLDRLRGGLPIEVAQNPPDLRGYVELALQGGFPSAIEIGEDNASRERWLESYVDQVVTRDAVALGAIRDPARLRRYFTAYAVNSAGFVSEQTLLEASELDRKTANSYERLLTDLFVVQPLPAWGTNRLQRLVHGPKRYLVDPSLIGALLRADVATVMRDADLLGRLIDTFVLAQLRAEQEVTKCRPVFHHLRERQGRREIDIIAEVRGQGIIAIEVKSSASPSRADAKHLEWLRDELGERFVAGVVFHTGPAQFSLAERITALPIASLWP